MVVRGHGQVIGINGQPSLEYLTLAFRSASNEGYVPSHIGASYHADVQFGTGSPVLVGLYVPDDVSGVTVGFPMDRFEDPHYYWIPLPQPIPASVSAAIEKIRGHPAH